MTTITPSQRLDVDIEHAFVEDDPREWSNTRKNVVLSIVAGASMIAGLAANIQNPSIEDIQTTLPATPTEISLSLALFILVQGVAPIVWSAISEVTGRKIVYLVSFLVFAGGSIVVATAKNAGLFIGFRMLQAAGSSVVMSIGAATLADIYDPAERGTKMGMYYIAPLLGGCLGPLFGGALTLGFSWRGSFWFLAIFAGVIFASFFFLFKETFRKERSLTYVAAWKERTRQNAASKATSMSRTSTLVGSTKDSEKQTSPMDEVKLSLKDVNPIKPMWLILRRVNNMTILVASGLFFAFNFCIAYTTARSLGTFYGYNALIIGLVFLSYGVGSICGTLSGGRWSDRVLAKMKEENGGVSYPEMRLKSTIPGMVFMPLSILGYAWTLQQRVHISAIIIMLFLCGFFSIWIYSSTLAYIVDANNGRSSTAIAANSCFRGISACVFTVIAVPMQDGIGDGWMYTIWAGLILFSEGLILLTMWKGVDWRRASEARESRHELRKEGKDAAPLEPPIELETPKKG